MQNTTQRDKAKHRNKRNRFTRAADLVLIERHALKGATHEQIREALNATRPYTLSRQMITHDLGKLRTRWLASTAASFADARALELRRLDSIESELWVEWERSKLGETGSNPAFTAQIVAIHDRRCKLLGLLSPTRCEISGPSGGAVQIEATAIPQGPIDETQKLDVLRRHVARLEQEAVAPAAKEPVSGAPAN